MSSDRPGMEPEQEDTKGRSARRAVEGEAGGKVVVESERSIYLLAGPTNVVQTSR